MVTIQVDEVEIKKMAKQQIERIVNEVEAEKVFWSAKDLIEKCSMSWNFIQEQFFHDPRFPKRKIGSKWFFPAKETRKFLEVWLMEQPKY